MHTNKFLLLTVVAVLAIAGVLITLNKPAGKEEIITSDDGTLKLKFSQKALPKGVDIRSIKVSQVDPGTDNEESLVYRLEPDGLILNEPAKIEIAVNRDIGDNIPILLHRSKDAMLPLDEVTVFRDNAQKKTTISAKLSHFSSMEAIFDLLRFSIDTPPSGYVGEPMRVSVSAENLRRPHIFIASKHDYVPEGTKFIYTIVKPWMIEGTIEPHRLGNLDYVMKPEMIKDVPPLTKIEGQKQSITIPAEFTCIRTYPKAEHLIYTAKISGELNIQAIWPPESGGRDVENSDRFTQQVTALSDSFECLDRVSPKPTEAAFQSKRIETSNLVPLDVLIIDNKFFPAKQFIVAGADIGCSANHYHAKYEVSDIGLNTHLKDPNSNGCGFGTVDKIPRRTENVLKEQADRFQ